MNFCKNQEPRTRRQYKKRDKKMFIRKEEPSELVYWVIQQCGEAGNLHNHKVVVKLKQITICAYNNKNTHGGVLNLNLISKERAI